MRGGDEETTSVGRVHVEPHGVPGADLADGAEGVDRAVVGGPGDGHHSRDFRSGFGQGGQGVVQGHGIHSIAVARQRDHGIRRKSEQARCFHHAQVGVFAGHDPQTRQPRAAVARTPETGLAGGEQRLEIGRAAAGGEHPVRGDSGGIVEPDEVGDPFDESLLDETCRGALVPGLHSGVDRRGQSLGCQRRDGDRAVEVGQVTRVVVSDGVIEVEGSNLPECADQIAQRDFQIHGGRAVREFVRGGGGTRGGAVVEISAHLRRGGREGGGVAVSAVATQQRVVHGALRPARDLRTRRTVWRLGVLTTDVVSPVGMAG